MLGKLENLFKQRLIVTIMYDIDLSMILDLI